MTSVTAPTQFLVLSEADLDKPLQVQLNGLVVVDLETNPSIGSDWRYEPLIGVPEQFELLSDAELSGKTPGSSGAHTFLFRAVRPGGGELRFQHELRGKPDGKPIQFTIKVVQPNT
ncbi:protease inhibitor I42 family protein [Kitasatospora sp. SUK 42]|uniref:protease inhibitor I42 family protein n=1 Tax=Kitasatospora sp. SUK 42 TaxID=1588882 RepID=UPI001C31B41D|nr:protease inhibitor I42 family protein [Kitasatospora sp. SUK 42]MBV2156802.1 protease inhibitor I42 family protein [Kitasatospora sp. SUK 42]